MARKHQGALLHRTTLDGHTSINAHSGAGSTAAGGDPFRRHSRELGLPRHALVMRLGLL